MEQDTPQPRRLWWPDPAFWVGAAVGVALFWAYKVGYMAGVLEARHD
jgi:hypothetical protein